MRSLPLAAFRRLFVAVCVVALAVFVVGKAGAQAGGGGAFRADMLGQGTVALDGPWQFHLGDNPEWAKPEINDATGHDGWEQLRPDKPWGAQGHANTEGFGWYRRRIDFVPGPGAPKELALLLPAVEDAYSVYWNGELVGTYGAFPPDPKWFVNLLPHTWGLGAARSGVLALRVWKAPLGSFDNGEQGGLWATPVLGTPTGIANAMAARAYGWLRTKQLTFGLTSLYGLVALLGFLAWARDRSQWLLFWMACFAMVKPLGLILTGLDQGISEVVGMGLNQPVYILGDVSLWYLLVYLLDLRDDQRLMRVVKVFAWIAAVESVVDGFCTVGFTFANPVPWQAVDMALMVPVMLLEFLPFYLILQAIVRRRKLEVARWVVALFAFLAQFTFTLGISLQQGARFTHLTWGTTLLSPLFQVNGNYVGLRMIFDTLLLVSTVYAVYRVSVETQRRQSALEREFQNARALQQVLIPETLPAVAGFELTSAYRPAQEVGGDFFQILPLGDGGTLVVLGDVSGKGLKAAMAVSLIVGMVRALADSAAGPGQLLMQLNDRLTGHLQGGFATCLALRVDAEGRCTMASAGHPGPYRNGVEVPIAGDLPLGLAAGQSYGEKSLNLAEGDHLALYTDGLLEARNPTGELFGFHRLVTLFAASPSADQAVEAAVEFGQDDDVTVLTLTRMAAAGRKTVAVPEPVLTPA